MNKIDLVTLYVIIALQQLIIVGLIVYTTFSNKANVGENSYNITHDCYNELQDTIPPIADVPFPIKS